MTDLEVLSMKTLLSATLAGLVLMAPVALHAAPPPHAAAWEHKKHHKERAREARKWEREREREMRKWRRERRHDAYHHRHENYRDDAYRYRSRSHDHHDHHQERSSLRIYLEL
jgi:hypothetical protein|tara:strand:- start:45 stop:383 length:339 start_codon:yes stop_codon:yes gene_type:complete